MAVGYFVLTLAMRPTLISLLSLFCSSVFAQNWQMFPADSLRYYVNPVQDTVFIQGIDYRQYEQYNDTTEIELGWFARLDTVESWGTKWVYQIKTANSSFGRKIFETPQNTTLLFVESYNGSISLGEMNFSKNRTPAFVWQIYENSTIRISGKIASVQRIGNSDSVCNVVVQITRKSDRLQKDFLMRYSKHLGLFQSPIFYDILAYPEKLEILESVKIYKYEELTEEEFFEITPGTELHYLDAGYLENNAKIGKWVFKEYQDDYAVFSDSKSYYRSNTYLSNDNLKINKVTGDKIYNPIPNKFRPDSFYHSRGYLPLTKYYPVCGRLVSCDFELEAWEFAFRSGDSIAFSSTSFGGQVQKMQGVGPWFVDIKTSGKQSTWTRYEWKYLKIPGECEIGNHEWRLTSVPETKTREIEIYPNPALRIINVTSLEPIVKVSAISATGEQVPINYNSDVVNIDHLKPGVYVLMIKTISKTYFKKLMVL
jgi:hypothetical protein